MRNMVCEISDEGGLQSDVGQYEFALQKLELNVLGADSEKDFLKEFVQHHLGDTFKDHSNRLV